MFEDDRHLIGLEVPGMARQGRVLPVAEKGLVTAFKLEPSAVSRKAASFMARRSRASCNARWLKRARLHDLLHELSSQRS